MKICKNCKYYRAGHYFDYCDHPDSGVLNIVTGEKIKKQAALMRSNTGLCSKEGRFFEQKPARISFWSKLTNKFK